LGYEQDMQQIAVPVGYQGLRTGKIDVFLGNWMPAQSALVDPLKAAGDIEVLNANLENVRFTLAVPAYVGQAGVTSVADLAKNADKFDSTIYGIEAGAPANQHIQKMIETNDFGLGGWKLVESSEQAMLAQVQRAARRENWVAFLAWEPHPMNTMLPITYLAGADAYFGPNYGSTTIYTVSRKGFAGECPNLATEGKDPKAAALERIKAEPAVLETWLAGVTTVKGEPGLPAVKQALQVN
jgi:glycine betaine/proline transport system substrate-binding protein